MNIEELAELSADKLNALSNDDLKKILEPFFVITRPELAPKIQKRIELQPEVYVSPQKREALRLLAEEGVDMSFLRKKKK